MGMTGNHAGQKGGITGWPYRLSQNFPHGLMREFSSLSRHYQYRNGHCVILNQNRRVLLRVSDPKLTHIHQDRQFSRGGQK
jgi:hypothetical protein